MQRLRSILLSCMVLFFSAYSSVVNSKNLEAKYFESSGEIVVCNWTLNQLICQEFMQDALSDYSWESNCNSPSCTYSISIGNYNGGEVVIIREECSAGLEFGYYWVMYDCDGNLIEECTEGLTGNCDSSAEYYQVDDLEVIFNCESDILPDNCECVNTSLACNGSVDVIVTNGMGTVTTATVLENEEQGCNYSFVVDQSMNQLTFDCSEIGTTPQYTVYNLDDGCNSCWGDLNIIDGGDCISCPTDSDSILCQTWLLNISNNLVCNTSDPSNSQSYKIYRIPNSGVTQVLVVQEQFVVSDFSNTYTLYSCSGDFIYQCNQGLTGDCNNLSLDPVLGPIINDTILIFNCETDVLNCSVSIPTIFIDDYSANVGEVVEVPISIENFQDIIGVQFGVSWDSTVVELVDVFNLNNQVPDFSEGNFCSPTNSCIEKGSLSISWFSAQSFTITNREDLFSLRFRVIGLSGSFSEIKISGSVPIEIIDATFNQLPIYVNEGSIQVLNNSSCTHPDYDALIALYNSTDGANWLNNSGWAEGEAGTNCDPCTWFGIGCDGNGRVNELVLNSNNLSGPIPIEIDGLTNLERLLLINNNLTGDVPSSFSQLVNLKKINLSVNSLSGTINFLSSLVNLEELNLFSNQFSGIIPDDLQNLTGLIELRLSKNDLNGTIPSSLSNLTNLEWLILSDNNLSGTIPNSLYTLPNLEWLWLYNNNLTGIISGDIGNLSNISTIALYNNNLEGEIPESLSSLSSLTYLNLSDNNLSSCLSQSLTSICGLGQLDRGIITSPTGATSLTNSYSFLRNNLLPYNGDFERICNGEPQIGAPCGIAQDSIIDANCDCVSINSNCTHPDYDALMALYNSTDGANWLNNDGWRDGADGTNCDPCTWFGIGCDNSGRVDSLRLFSNNLFGVIPVEFGQLSNLTGLNLGSNNLSGDIPDEISQLTNLTSLFLYGNSFTGDIFDGLGSLLNLQFLSLNENEISGVIPVEIGQLLSLEYLGLYGNKLTGEIPAELGQLSELRDISLFDNNLTGQIPSSIGNLSKLNSLLINDNNFSNCLPAEIFVHCGLSPNLTNLFQEGYNLTGNPLLPYNGDFERICNGDPQIGAPCGIAQDSIIDTNCDCVPVNSNCTHPDLNALIALYNSTNGLSWDEKLGWEEGAAGTSCDPCDFNGTPWSGIRCDGNNRVVEVKLNSNDLMGIIPSELRELSSLEILWLNSNELSNEIPRELGELSNLVQLFLHVNNLSGDIPIELGQLSNLTNLNLSQNDLSGQIPQELGSLSNVISLLLFNNELMGEIPEELGQLTSVIRLNFSQNLLEGGIPQELGLLSNLEELYLYDNNLTGPITAELNQLSNLKILDASRNQLSSALPMELSQLTQLNKLIIHNNDLLGEVPKEFEQLTNIEAFYVHNNNLSGCIPDGLQNICSLQENLNNSFDPGYNFTGNHLLPYNGDFERICNGDPQIGAPCGIAQDSIIDANCNCVAIQPCPEIEWINLPSDITISPSEISSIVYNLPYSNMGDVNCIEMGTATADTTLTSDGCDKILLLEWTATESGVTILAQQNIRITNIPEPVWINPPANVTIDCSEVSLIDDILEYNNGETGICEIRGTQFADIINDNDPCNDFQVLTWTLDASNCFAELNHVQNIEIESCDLFSINDDFFSANTKESQQFDLLDNDDFPQDQISISIVEDLDNFVVDTMLTQDGIFTFRLEQSFFDTVKVIYEVCDTLCGNCDRATLFITDNIFEDVKPTNFLSPNGDGSNDELRFTIESEIDDSELWIFNRSGAEVYYKRNYTNDWQAEGHPAGIYFYVLKVRGAELKNTLTVLK